MRNRNLKLLVPIALLAFALLPETRTNGNSQTRSPDNALMPAQQRGRQIYFQGTSVSGQSIVARIAGGGVELPSTARACVNCHGADGLGRSEGGVTPSNIKWDALTKPYLVTQAGGRKRPPYTEALVERAITGGLDSGGSQLHVAMPRYRLAAADLADLIAYLKVISRDFDPGLTESTIRIGTSVINNGPLAETTAAVRAVLGAYFDDINQGGGIFNRRIELSIAESGGSTDERVGALRRSTEQDQVFALTGVVTDGADSEIASLSGNNKVPLIGAITQYPQVAAQLNRYVFYFSPGVANEGRALAAFAAEKFHGNPPGIAILFADGDDLRDASSATRKQCEASGLSSIEEIRLPTASPAMQGLVQQLKQKRVGAVFLLAAGEAQEQFLSLALESDWRPQLFVPGSLTGRAVVNPRSAATGQIFISVSSLPSDQTRDGLAEYRRLAQEHRLPSASLATQLTALASAKVLVEGLKRAGRSVSRQRLIDELERLYQFETGLTRPLTFNANRRIGSLGAYIVEIDEEGRIVTDKWVELN